MSWVGGGWEQDWSGSGCGESEAPTINIPTLTSWLKPRNPITLSTNFKALERDEEEEEEDGTIRGRFLSEKACFRCKKLTFLLGSVSTT